MSSPIPPNLAAFSWYGPHQAWELLVYGACRHDPAGAAPLRASLIGASLRNASLDDASLRNASLDDASLDGASLDGASLDGAAGAVPVPIVADIDRAILAAVEDAPARFDMGSWHSVDGVACDKIDIERGNACGTTHCRAGWAIHLAGEAGYALERWVGPRTAGALIYAASRPGKPIPDFCATTDAALADLRKCAAQ